MNAKKLVWIGLLLQAAYLFWWLFSAPEFSGTLRIARDELQKGEANLPALTVQHADGSRTTISYNANKSDSENLAARAQARFSLANSAFESIVSVSILQAVTNGLILVGLLWKTRAANTPDFRG